ncbi:hypothetical protein LENED_001612 [Lentinula edodes]|uniref:Uncharacterized protein n=1 Tax=Lentinula edodes TaxID=5353 RepID=A0A1Q3DYN2_LENED|nr:hypothetical protein LENED_001612 [Lentinula edodes]
MSIEERSSRTRYLSIILVLSHHVLNFKFFILSCRVYPLGYQIILSFFDFGSGIIEVPKVLQLDRVLVARDVR